MKIRWSPIDAICKELVSVAGDATAFWIDDESGQVVAGQRPEDVAAAVSSPITARFGPIGRVNVAGDDSQRWLDFLLKTCEREIATQETVRDMADATARQWRHTNALLRMAENMELALRPGLAVEKVLSILSRSTCLGSGIGVVRLPGESVYTAFNARGHEQVLDPMALKPLEDIVDEVRLITDSEDDKKFRSACSRIRGVTLPAAYGRLATENGSFGFLLAPVQDPDAVTSEDFKMLSAASKILGVAIENGYTLSKERESTRLKVENELLETQAREMEEMIHVVAHDLRSPMTSMYGFMHVAIDEVNDLKQRLVEEHQEAAAENAEAIAEPINDGIRSVEKLNKMIQRLLDFSRSARISYKHEVVDMDKLADGVVRSLNYELGRRGITVEREELPPVYADEFQVEAVYGNLVDNAIKYMGDNGERRIVLGSLPGESTVYFVKDTGIGMSKDEVAKVFLPFMRFKQGSAPGEGIGMAHVRKIIERHGGRVWCESEEGVGTTFFFTFGQGSLVTSSESAATA